MSRPPGVLSFEDTRFARGVVHIIWHLGIGGGEVFLRGLTGALARRGVPQHVFTIGPPGPLAAEVAAEGVPVVSFHKSSRAGGLTIARMAAALVRLRPLLVQTHGEGGMYWGLPAARLARVPAVSLLYQNAEETPIKTRAARLLLRSPVWVIAGSHDVARFMQRTLHVPAARVRTIHCGIDTRLFAGLSRDVARGDAGPVLVTVGRLVGAKGHHVLIDALAIVGARHPNVRLVIVGDGPDRAALEARVSRRGLSDRVVFAGTVYPTHPVLARADVFVFPSLVEPQGLALLEAYAAGVPVVASRTGGIPEMLEEGREGLLAPPGDAAGLAAAIERMLTDEPLRRRVVAGARQRVAAFDIAAVADEYLALYAALGDVRPLRPATRAGGAGARV